MLRTLIVVVSLFFSSISYGIDYLFYMIRTDATNHVTTYAPVFQNFKHDKDHNIIVPQAFQIDADGTLLGSVDTKLLGFAQQHNVKIMPLVTDVGFEANKVTKFLDNKKAQASVIDLLAKTCKEKHYYGMQIDFEGIPATYRRAYTEFFAAAAKALHSHGCLISATILPRIADQPGDSAYLEARFKHWSGVYDYKELAKHSDFVTLMAYDQHEGFSTPGPIAGYTWDEDIIKYALKYIPANKISLGIPTYSGFWHTMKVSSGNIRAAGDQITYNVVNDLIHRFKAVLYWDDIDKVHYTFYPHNQLYDYIFVEDARSFKAKLDLINQYHLRGISVWRLGIEDPGIWRILFPQGVVLLPLPTMASMS